MGPVDLAIRPLSPGFGVEVLGLDLGRDINEPVKQSLRDAWDRHSLLLFRDQLISDDDVDRVASIFGEITQEGPVGDNPYVSNTIPDGLVPNGELFFHTDLSFVEHPVLHGLVLYAHEVPPEGAGGDTLFSSVKLAYQLLPAELRERIKHLQIVHKSPYHPQVDPPLRATKSMVYTHPVTSEKILYCSPRHFEQIVGMTAEEGQALVDELAAYISRPEIVYKHSWRPYDLVLWDNLVLQHARTNFDPNHRRHLRRSKIGLRVPVTR